MFQAVDVWSWTPTSDKKIGNIVGQVAVVPALQISKAIGSHILATPTGFSWNSYYKGNIEDLSVLVEGRVTGY